MSSNNSQYSLTVFAHLAPVRVHAVDAGAEVVLDIAATGPITRCQLLIVLLHVDVGAEELLQKHLHGLAYDVDEDAVGTGDARKDWGLRGGAPS